MKEKNVNNYPFPCPFCGMDVGVADASGKPYLTGSFWYSVQCIHCSCEGPLSKDKDEAEYLWNRYVHGWHPIKDAPRDGRKLLLLVNGEVVMSEWNFWPDVPRYDDPYWLNTTHICPTYGCHRPYLESSYPEGSSITHWREIPAPPEIPND